MSEPIFLVSELILSVSKHILWVSEVILWVSDITLVIILQVGKHSKRINHYLRNVLVSPTVCRLSEELLDDSSGPPSRQNDCFGICPVSQIDEQRSAVQNLRLVPRLTLK